MLLNTMYTTNKNVDRHWLQPVCVCLCVEGRGCKDVVLPVYEFLKYIIQLKTIQEVKIKIGQTQIHIYIKYDSKYILI